MDTEKIKELVQLMVENDMNRIEIQEGETHILLKRGQQVVAGPVQTLAAPASAAPAPAAASAVDSSAPQADPNEIIIRSPMVGTYYSAPDPESPAFISVGDNVGPDSVVCLVEAMKVFNEIKAEVSGRITKVLVKNAEAVEYDQPLFAVTSA